MKNSNLFYMDTLNMRKAAKDPKDSTLVEHRITSDGFKDFHTPAETMPAIRKQIRPSVCSRSTWHGHLIRNISP